MTTDDGAEGAVESQADPQDYGASLAFGRNGHAQLDHQRNATPARQEAHEALKADDGDEVRVVGVDVGAKEVGLVRAERIAPLDPLEDRGVSDGAVTRALERRASPKRWQKPLAAGLLFRASHWKSFRRYGRCGWILVDVRLHPLHWRMANLVMYIFVRVGSLQVDAIIRSVLPIMMLQRPIAKLAVPCVNGGFGAQWRIAVFVAVCAMELPAALLLVDAPLYSIKFWLLVVLQEGNALLKHPGVYHKLHCSAVVPLLALGGLSGMVRCRCRTSDGA